MFAVLFSCIFARAMGVFLPSLCVGLCGFPNLRISTKQLLLIWFSGSIRGNYNYYSWFRGDCFCVEFTDKAVFVSELWASRQLDISGGTDNNPNIWGPHEHLHEVDRTQGRVGHLIQFGLLTPNEAPGIPSSCAWNSWGKDAHPRGLGRLRL